MKLRHLKATGVAGLKTAQMGLEESVSVVVGDAFSGKTSVRDAIGLALIGRVRSRFCSTWDRDHAMALELEVEGSRIRVGPRSAPDPDRRALRKVLGDEDLVEMLLAPEAFLDAEPWRRKRLIVGSISLDPVALVGRLRALGLPGHHGVLDAMTGNIPAALARVRAALRDVEGRRVVVSEPEDPVVETPRGPCRVSVLPPVAELEAVLAPVLDAAEAAGADLPAAAAGDVVGLAAKRAEAAAGAAMARALEQDALGWTEADEKAYEARIAKTETAKGALAVAEQRAMAAAESVAYLADLEDADKESPPTCPTCRHAPTAAQVALILRCRTQASNDLATAHKAVWEARQVLADLAVANDLIEKRAAAFTAAEAATDAAKREAEDAKRALEALVADTVAQDRARKDLALLRDRISRGRTLIALRRTYDSARGTFEAAEAARVAVDAEAQRYRDAERLLVAASEGVTEVELGGALGTMNAALASTSVPLFRSEAPVVSIDEDWCVRIRGNPMWLASSTELYLASIACGHALAMLSGKNVLVVDGLEKVGYEHLDRILAWLLEVGEAYDNLIVTVSPNCVTPKDMAVARTVPERAHVRYYHIDTPGVISPVLAQGTPS